VRKLLLSARLPSASQEGTIPAKFRTRLIVAWRTPTNRHKLSGPARWRLLDLGEFLINPAPEVDKKLQHCDECPRHCCRKDCERASARAR
jgi:hypothetical protein